METADQFTKLELRIAELELENKNLHETVTFLTRKLFGKSSETSKSLNIEGQMSLFDEAEVEANPTAIEPTLEEVAVVIRKKYKGQRKEKLDNLPRKKVLFKLDSEDLSCPQCSTDLKSVGEEFVRSEVEYIPAQLNVIDYYRETYECRGCKNTDEPYMEKTPMPSPVIPHSFASPSSVAHVMYQKFVNAMPLYRQEKDWSNLGLNLTRQTMSNWILIASRDWLMPIVNLLHKKMLEETIYMLMKPGFKSLMKRIGKTRLIRLCGYMGLIRIQNSQYESLNITLQEVVDMPGTSLKALMVISY